MQNIRDFIRGHGGILLVAFLVGVTIVAPQLYFRYLSGDYRGIDFFKSDVENNYLAQIQEVYDNHYSLGNIYVADGKNGPHAIQQPLSAWIVAGLGKLLGIRAHDVNIVTKFLFPFLLSLLVYALFLKLTKEKWYAFLATAFTMLAPATLAFFYPGSWLQVVLHGNFPASDYQFLTYSRPINPQTSSFFFYGYLLFLWQFLYEAKTPRAEKVSGITSAVLLGLSFYTYFFVFSFIAFGSALLFLWFLLKKDYRHARKVLFVGCGGLIIAIPAFMNFFQTIQSPFYSQVTARVGAYLTHRFIWSRVWFGTFLIALLFHRKFTHAAFKTFIFFFLITAFVLTNQQVLTGRIFPAPQHYHWYYAASFSGVIFLFLIYYYLRRYAKTRFVQGVVLGLLAVFFWSAILFQVKSYQDKKPLVSEEGRYADVLAWLDQHTSKDASVFGNQIFSSLVVGYTHDNAYYHGGLTDFLVPRERLEQGFFVYTALAGVGPKDVEVYFQAHRDFLGGWVFGEQYRQQNGCSGCFPDGIFNELVADYRAFLSKDFVRELKRYPLDYAVWDKKSDPAWKLDRFFQSTLYNKDDIVIYRVL